MKLSFAIGGVALGLVGMVCSAQGTSPKEQSALARGIAKTTTQVASRLDTFVQATAVSGLPCAIAPPRLVVRDVPSFGSYDPGDNTLTTPAWEQMSTEEQAIFYKFPGPGATEAQARGEFEIGVHHWVFVHELGHWWEACQGIADHDDHYAFELEADRIAAAYWRQKDLSLITHQKAVFEAILKNWPNPVPPGQSAIEYFNNNFEALAPTPAYIWFQAQMCLTAFAQTPPPKLQEVLAQTKTSQPKK